MSLFLSHPVILCEKLQLKTPASRNNTTIWYLKATWLAWRESGQHHSTSCVALTELQARAKPRGGHASGVEAESWTSSINHRQTKSEHGTRQNWEAFTWGVCIFLEKIGSARPPPPTPPPRLSSSCSSLKSEREQGRKGKTVLLSPHEVVGVSKSGMNTVMSYRLEIRWWFAHSDFSKEQLLIQFLFWVPPFTQETQKTKWAKPLSQWMLCCVCSHTSENSHN